MLYELMVSEFSLNQKMRVNLIYKNLGNILTAYIAGAVDQLLSPYTRILSMQITTFTTLHFA